MKPIHLVLIIILLIGGAALLGKLSGANPTKTANDTSPKTTVFKTTVQDYKYQPESIDVDFGDTVTIEITNRDPVTHGINLPVFGVKDFVDSGQTKTISFVANQRGNPELFCSSDHGEKLLINVI